MFIFLFYSHLFSIKTKTLATYVFILGCINRCKFFFRYIEEIRMSDNPSNFENIIMFLLEKSSFFIANIIFILLCIAFFTLIERKVMSNVQRRKGPNITGLFGFLQPFADGLKLLIKEIIVPSNSNFYIFILSPVITFFFTIFIFLMLPVIPGYIILDSPFSIILLLAISSLSVHGIIFSGWSSNSKYAFLGSIRSASQMISYEICISTVFIGIILVSGSYSLVNVVLQQEDIWFIVPLFPFWVLFFIVSLAETNRAPFDLPEAEAELVAGYNVEYSSILFAMFFLAEYGNILIISSISTIFFFGGWNPIALLPFLSSSFIFAIKVSFNVCLFLIVRAAFPRYRYDHLMKLGWKNLLPISFFF